jgi:hypothetical protein
LPAVLREHEKDYGCTAVDLSRTGVLLVGEIPTPDRPEIEFAILSHAGDLEQRFVGRVARIEAGGEGKGTRLAVEFLALDLAQKDVLELLLSRVLERQAPARLESVRPGAPPGEVRKALELVPLPLRIALASRGNPRERELLRQDTHSQVIEALARNSNLLLAEARALASIPHALPPTLEILAADPRWSKDEEMRILLATHPRIPLPLAERLSADLKKPALRKMLSRPALNPALRDRIVKRLARG